jgi:hypothetical protein
MQHPDAHPNTQRGATRQTRRFLALRPVLKGMMDNVTDPHASEDRDTVKEQFLQFMNSAAGAQYRETAFIYWLDNNYRALLADYPEPEKDLTPRAERKAEKGRIAAAMKQKVEQAIEQKAQIILLDWVLPNGKALRDCTGRDCRQMSGTVGTWLRKIADRIKPTELVGSVLQEADVRKLFPGTKS